MLTRVPDYFERFSCLAGACPHSCCIGWEVVIDPATAARYRALPGALGEQLRAALRTDEDGDDCFPLRGGRCPFLDGEDLCEIHRTLGEDATSATCRTHPRFTEEYGPFREISLAASCPAAAALLLGERAPLTFRETETPGEPEPGDPWLEPLLAVRERMFGLLSDRDAAPPAPAGGLAGPGPGGPGAAGRRPGGGPAGPGEGVGPGGGGRPGGWPRPVPGGPGPAGGAGGPGAGLAGSAGGGEDRSAGAAGCGPAGAHGSLFPVPVRAEGGERRRPALPDRFLRAGGVDGGAPGTRLRTAGGRGPVQPGDRATVERCVHPAGPVLGGWPAGAGALSVGAGPVTERICAVCPAFPPTFSENVKSA